MEGDAGVRSVRLWAAKRVKDSGQRAARRSATDRDDLVTGFAAAGSTVEARLGWRFCGSRVSGAEPAMVRYRLGCRRGGNGRRGGLPSLWAKARMGVAAVSLRLILAMLRNESHRRYRRSWGLAGFREHE